MISMGIILRSSSGKQCHSDISNLPSIPHYLISSYQDIIQHNLVDDLLHWYQKDSGVTEHATFEMSDLPLESIHTDEDQILLGDR
ncbi:hypothetical protein DsansV1_C29g0209511 [Dioscorea sansibarensis]